MRIVHVYKDFYPPVTGGVERYIHDLCTGLRASGLDARALVTRMEPGTAAACSIRDGIPVTEVRSLGRILSNPVFTGLAKGMRDSGADLFHFHHPLPAAVFAWRRARLDTPYIVTYHSDIVRQAFLMPILEPGIVRFLEGAEAVLATSPAYVRTSSILSRLHNVQVLPPGVDTIRFSPGTAAPAGYFLFVGKFRRYKGLDVLLEAWRSMGGARLVLAGGGPLESRMRRRAAELGIDAEIRGGVSDDELVELYRGAQAFILPSTARSEAFGLVQLEAMACGTPVISTNLATGVPWVNEDGVSGIVVPPADPGALASAIRRLMDDRTRAHLSEGALRRARTLFDSRDHLAEVEALCLRAGGHSGS